MKFSIEIDVPLGDTIALARLNTIRAILIAMERGVREAHEDHGDPHLAEIIEDLQGTHGWHACEFDRDSSELDIAKAFADVERELRILLAADHYVKLRVFDMGPAA